MASDFDVTNEIRFAVVMYGGVSLAIYMNGIAQELLHLVRSTARKGWEGDEVCQFRFADDELAWNGKSLSQARRYNSRPVTAETA